MQFEGFDIQAPDEQAEPPPRQDTRFTVAFSSRDLSSSKGFETFMRLVDRLVREAMASRCASSPWATPRP